MFGVFGYAVIISNCVKATLFHHLQICFRQLLGTEEDSSDHVSSDDDDELLGTGKFFFV